jgi:hypothetical protein
MITRCLVYKYGLLAPTGEDRERVVAALRHAHKLYNNAIEVYRKAHDSYRALGNNSPEIVKAQAAYDQWCEAHAKLSEQINTRRGNRPAEGKEEHVGQIKALQEQAKKAKVQKETALKELKALRKTWDKTPEGIAALSKINEASKASLKQLRQESPLECTTATSVLDSAKQAAFTAGGQPRFRRWAGEGTLYLQLPYSASGGARYQAPHWIFTDQPPAKRGHGPNPFVQVNPVDPRAWDDSLTKGQRKYHQRTRLRFRVSRDGRTPIWAEFPMMLHRPFPDDALVCGVSVSVKKVGSREVWSVQFTLKVPDEGAAPLPSDPKAIGIDWGWRKTPEGYRVAYWADSEGGHGQLVLPVEVISKIEHADSIRGVRDVNLDVLRARLRADLNGNRGQLSDEVREKVRSLHQWRSPSRFAGLWLRHGDELRPLLSDLGEEEAFRADPHLSKYSNYFEAWLHRDRHLWQYEAGARRSAYARRNHIYQNWAAEFAAKYDLIVCEDIKVANLAKKPAPENKPELPDSISTMNNASSRQRSRAAVGFLRTFIINTCKGAGRTVVKANAANTSRIHHVCGTKVNVGHQLHPTCPVCEVEYDRDQNAALNILARGLGTTKTPGALAKANLKQNREVSQRQEARKQGLARSKGA